MARRRVWILLGLLMVAAVGLAWPAASNAGGAPSNAAMDGCTCHNAAADPMVRVSLTGLPSTYAPGTSYDLNLAIEGGPPVVMGVSMNQGGLAVHATGGRLVAGTGTQVDDADSYLTHTAQGNDQRTWSFKWEATANLSGPVTVHFAGNAVNGDGNNGGGLDRWNKGVVEVAAPAANLSAPPSPPATETPGIESIWLVSAGATVALVLRRRHV